MLKTVTATVAGMVVMAGPAAAEQFDGWEQYQDKYAGVVLKRTGASYQAVGWTKDAGPGTEWCFRGKGTQSDGEPSVTVSGHMWWPDQKGRKKAVLLVTGSPDGRKATVEVLRKDIPGWTIGPAKLTKKKPRYGFERTCQQ